MEDKVEFKDGIKITWDSHGNAFVSMPVNNIPKKQFDKWWKHCKDEYSGKRWDLIFADRIKADAYEVLMNVHGGEQPEDNAEENNPMGLLNGGND